MTFRAEWAFRDCPHCGLRDAQLRVAVADVESAPARGRAKTWTVLTCPRCANATLVETTKLPNRPPDLVRTIPAGHDVVVAHLPADVESYFADAVRVLDAGVPDAAAVQLRRTLEAAAAHHGVDTGPLVTRIRKLIDAGLITTNFREVLDHVRQVGNIGAHASDARVDDETARRALRFTTQVLRNLFEIPAELAALNDAEPTAATDAG